MKYFVTGGTGFIGSHFIALMARCNEIHALVRGEDPGSARERLLVRLKVAVDAYSDYREVDESHLHCITGNIEVPDLGIKPSSISALCESGIDMFWHFAASLDFNEKNSEIINKRNIEGVKNAIALAARLQVKRFVYISTAYTAGAREGEIHETLHNAEGPFNNRYEESKCTAEHLVAELCEEYGIDYAILRPSVIIGVSGTKKSGGTSTGLYAFIRDLYHMKHAVDSIGVQPRLYADTGMVVNFNPIDGVMADIQYLVDNDFPKGPIYHLSSSYGFTLGDGIDLISQAVGIANLELVNEEPLNRTPIDELIGKRSEFYKSYIFHPKNFQRSIPLSHGCTLEDLRGYVSSYVEELNAQQSRARLRRETIMLSDGVPVDAYCCTGSGKRQAILIVTAFGMPVDFWLKFINLAGKTYDIYTWETRYLPCNSPLEGTDISPNRHVRDAVEILDHFGIERAHVLGWCTGAKLALKMARRHSERVCSLTLLSGGYNIDGPGLKTPYENRLTDTLLEVTGGLDVAELYYDLIYNGDSSDEESDQRTRSILHATNADYVQYTSLPFRSPENIYRYARLISSFYEDRDIGWLKEIKSPTLLITSKDDINTHPAASRYVANNIDGAICIEIDEGDHYLMDSHTQAVFQHFCQHVSHLDGDNKLPAGIRHERAYI